MLRLLLLLLLFLYKPPYLFQVFVSNIETRIFLLNIKGFRLICPPSLDVVSMRLHIGTTLTSVRIQQWKQRVRLTYFLHRVSLIHVRPHAVNQIL